MHSTYLITALAAAASVVSAHKPSPIVGELIDIDAPVGIVAPVLNKADIEILDLKKKRGHASLIDFDAPIGVVAPVLNNLDLEILDLKKRGGINVNIGLHVEVAIKVDNLVKGVLKTLEPVFELIEETVSHAEDFTTEELSAILAGAFGKIHKATSGLCHSLQSTGAGFEKRTRSNTNAERALSSNEDVAEALSVLLNKVAGAVNLAEGLLGKLPILGGVLLPLFGQINGDLSLILSSVGNLLVGVVSLVKDLLNGVFGTVHGLLSLEASSADS
ncbi:hypothetical protein P389DRAFT_205267 [Cystobasidium minutum MCA 4210]|uniref:uncharacterized protein n=1 Tax=Cystobasidium minutum MCA 4210 TaxID=1397322 RepID=UPI0034CD19B9|eukprot:jgi/Rhomi1/205267/MIX6096_12_72